MQCKVPQDVLRADKIVGFLTLRQLIICIIGGGITYALYMSLSKQYVLVIWLPPVLITTVITMGFAFVKYHDIVFERLILTFIEYKFKPQIRTWSKMKGDVLFSVFAPGYGAVHAKAKKQESMSDNDRRKRLEEISQSVDTNSSHISSVKLSALSAQPTSAKPLNTASNATPSTLVAK